MSDADMTTARNRAKPETDKNFVRQAESKATHLVEEGADKAEAALEKGEHMKDAATAQIKESREMLVEKIRENPLSAIAIAFGVGMLFSASRR